MKGGMEEELARVEVFLGDVQNLPTLPEMVGKLNKMLSDPEVDIARVAELILKDPVLTAHVLRLANSSFFAKHRQITNVREAVVFLGFRALRNLVITTLLVGSFRWKYPNVNPRRFWEHSFATAIVAQEIGKRLAYPDLDEAYLAGLVHDLGIILISQYLPDKMIEISRVIEKESIALFQAEEKVLGVGHPAFGAWLAQKWKFDAGLLATIFYHERPEQCNEACPLVALVSLADVFCRSSNLGYGVVEYWSTVMQQHPAWSILQREFPVLADTDWVRFRLDLQSKAEEIRVLVKTVFESTTEQAVTE